MEIDVKQLELLSCLLIDGRREWRKDDDEKVQQTRTDDDYIMLTISATAHP